MHENENEFVVSNHKHRNNLFFKDDHNDEYNGNEE